MFLFLKRYPSAEVTNKTYTYIITSVQVLKWYLSSFHASRKSSVAKKPYNPILGEVFR